MRTLSYPALPHSAPFQALNDQPYQVEYGFQVRLFFKNDLSQFPPGFCFLPEWICSSMTEAALLSHHRIIFYPVNRMNHSKIPLETAWTRLIEQIIEYEQYQRDIIILAAFPLGYIDRRIIQLYAFLQENRKSKIHLFLDLSQSYGSYCFLNDLDQTTAIYLSFNGRKLISSGGALRISNARVHSSPFSLNELQEKVDAALKEQEKNWLANWIAMADYWKRGRKELIDRFNVFNSEPNRSSYQRTALLLPNESPMSSLLVQEGFGQPIHPQPQQKLALMSPAYQEWSENILLLFPYRRTQPIERQMCCVQKDNFFKNSSTIKLK